MQNPSSKARIAALAATITLLAATAMLVTPVIAATDAGIPEIVQKLFAQRPDEPFVSVVFTDAARGNYLAFHISTYMDVKELRVYLVPFRGADRAKIDAALAQGDHETAFQILLAGMRVDLGGRYVSDAGLDGINDRPVPLGSGSLRDNFHRAVFADYAAADRVYRQWLQRGLELVTR